MRAAPGETQRTILDLAEGYVCGRGYHAFSFADVAAEIGVKPAAVHYHFRTKPDLVVAVLARWRGRFRHWARGVAGDAAEARLSAYVALSRELLARDRLDPFGTLAGELHQLPEAVQAELRGWQEDLFGWFSALLAEGRESGCFRFEGPADAKAATLACALLGAQQVGRVSGIAAFEAVAAQVPRDLSVPP